MVDQAVRGAEFADSPVLTSRGVATVLYKLRPQTRVPAEELELFETNVADTEQACPAVVVNGLHRPPRFAVRRCQTGMRA